MSVSAQTISPVSMPDDYDEGEQAEVAVRRILLVDEQAHVLRVIRLNLERCGYLVDAVMSADLAMQHVRTHQYDALILTSDLPDMTSSQLYERTRVLLDDHVPDRRQIPLTLVGHDAGEEWPDEVQNRESLCRPVSLRLILIRLEKQFASAECRGAECL
ncbi:response regulator transcription factor [Granulosicoccus antarcticus]|uniref:Response regulatory domain-containing protein n=1 Tax=Granulosicoccus antarcticus IMCC3135 TaxID=1192854 RepID=A0A2Z2P4K5_9GAMM|nr:response regulator transcription factor [Granulosicoccus antarcticus]ASJ75607.1 hypothetical protein IMCC3135_27770 [Granulosicoccus antarcticus IMCC3135]